MAVLAAFTFVLTLRYEQRYPPLGDFVTVDGIKLHYVDVGEGPAVVLLHGASANLRDFDASLLEPLSKHFRVIAIDRPGFGYSGRPNGKWPSPAVQAGLVRGLLRKLGINQVTLVGHSWSGSVVLAYALSFPEHMARGVLLAGGTHPWQGGVAWHADLGATPLLGPLFAHTLALPLGNLAINSAVARVMAPNQVPEGYIEQTGARLALRPKQFLANAQDLSELSHFLSKQKTAYSQINTPLLLLTADQDDIVPAWNHAERLLEQASSARLVEITHAGHAFHHAYPQLIADKIRQFALPLNH